MSTLKDLIRGGPESPNGTRNRVRNVPTQFQIKHIDEGRPGFFAMSAETNAEILANHSKPNRTITRRYVDRYVEFLVSGRWVGNSGGAISFDWDGNLHNGYHRLNASVQSGVPLLTHVIFGVDPASFHFEDRGKGRSNADDLDVRGEKNTRMLAAALAILWNEEQGHPEQLGNSPSSEEACGVLDRHPEIRESVRFATMQSSRLTGVLPTRIVAYCHYRFSQLDPGLAAEFFEGLITGAGLEREDPVLMLRNRLLQNVKFKAKLQPSNILALTIKAWNHRRRGTSVRYLGWRSDGPQAEPFPSIV